MLRFLAFLSCALAAGALRIPPPLTLGSTSLHTHWEGDQENARAAYGFGLNEVVLEEVPAPNALIPLPTPPQARADAPVRAAAEGLAAEEAGGDEELGEASEFLESFSKGMENVASIAKYFGPEGEAVAGVAELVGGLTGLGGVLTKQKQPDPNKALAKKVAEGFTALASKFKDVEASIASLKKQVLKSEIAVLFAKPEEVLLTFSDSASTLANNQTTVEDFLNKLKPYVVYSGDFTTSFGFIRDCISGHNQACAIGGTPFVDQVGEALSYRPSQIGSFFAYYQMLLVNAAASYCAVEVAMYPGKTCDPTYARSITAYANATKQYFGESLQMDSFMCAHERRGTLPKVISDIVAKHPNQGRAGSAAIMNDLTTELNTYYNPVMWYGYWIVALFQGNSNWQLQTFGKTGCQYGSTAVYKNVNGYNVFYAFVPQHYGSPFYNANLTKNFSSCISASPLSARVSCLNSKATMHWYTLAFQSGGNWFYDFKWGNSIPGGLCTAVNGDCGKWNPVAIEWVSADKSQFLIQG